MRENSFLSSVKMLVFNFLRVFVTFVHFVARLFCLFLPRLSISLSLYTYTSVIHAVSCEHILSAVNLATRSLHEGSKSE